MGRMIKSSGLQLSWTRRLPSRGATRLEHSAQVAEQMLVSLGLVARRIGEALERRGPIAPFDDADH
jgi:hypothetical protein